MKSKTIKLYHHKTDGGAGYLFDTFVKCPNGHKEGVINDKTKVVIRLDGKPEITLRPPYSAGADLLDTLEKGEAIISGLEAEADNNGLDLDEVRAWWANAIPVILAAGGKLR